MRFINIGSVSGMMPANGTATFGKEIDGGETGF